MKYRRLSETGDYVFGFGSTCFLTDTDAVLQAIGTKLKLLQGDNWENTNEGLPFFQNMAGSTNKEMIDLVVQTRIKETPGVSGISSFSSDMKNRKYTATVAVTTIYGTTVEVTV